MSSSKTKSTLATLATALLLAGGLGLTAAAPASAASARHDDFNGDGYRDLVVAAPSATVSGQRAAGYVAVMWGGKSGISTSRRTIVSQSTSGVPGTSESGDAFGKAVASGDFDADGYADLAVGIPGEDVGTTTDAGSAVILWGASGGLTGGSTSLRAEEPQAKEQFGKAMATGRFNADIYNDLAIMANTGTWEIDGGGSVQATALKRQSTLAEPGVIPTNMVSGDFDGDGYTDIVEMGVRTGDRDGQGWSGWYPGSDQGLYFERELPGGPVGAAGDINKDGRTDLVTAEPMSVGQEQLGGKVEVWYGTTDGPAATPRVLTQDAAGVPGVNETGDRFGSDLSIRDVNGDGYGDLAIGAEGEDIGSVADAGAVWLVRGSSKGVTTTGVQTFNQDSSGVPGTAEKLDRFGGQVRLIDANADGRAGLIAAAPGENTFDGIAWVFNGTTGGLSASGSWTFGGSSIGAPYIDAQFGSTMGE